MSTSSTIRLARTDAIERTLKRIRKRYPTLNDSEIFKLALSHLATDTLDGINEVTASAAHAVGIDYLSDPEEDAYTIGSGKKVAL